jgi:carbamoyltransferase
MNILGLSVATTEHHAAALVVDGQLVAVVEEERLSRVKHHGARPRAEVEANLCNDSSIRLEEVLCRRAVASVLSIGGLETGDIDRIAINGLRPEMMPADTRARPPIISLDGGRIVHVPHHLCHAASAWRLSGMPAAAVLTMDGRGERETAAWFEGRNGSLRRRWDVLYGDGHSLGGCYETASRMLGFGPYGQGALMALAAGGTPSVDLSDALHVVSHTERTLDFRRLQDLLEPFRRAPEEPLTPLHADAAASIQVALEEAVLALVQEGMDTTPSDALCLAGGVALNCRLNRRILEETGVQQLFVQPAAHDAGTAVGAALEVAALEVEPPAAPLRTAAWGPSPDEQTIADALEGAGLVAQRVADPAVVIARHLMEGRIVCRLDGRMEMGPRALGQRSILGDPRRPQTRLRLNRMKGRESWRPFGPSVRAEDVYDWFEEPIQSPYMLLTSRVRESQREKVPAIVHLDGTSRPQIVERRSLPAFAAILDAFHEATGVPMVVNTSFNRGGEPIVCTPADAIVCWRALGAEVLQMGNFIVSR